MKTLRFCALALMLVMTPLCLQARRFALSTNLIDYAALCTVNLDAAYAVDRQWSLSLGGRYNPWTFRKGDVSRQFQTRQISVAAGARYWPWHVYSGWWISGKIRYQEYNFGGILSRGAREGDRVGASFSAGYTYMLRPNLNIEFGIGFWTGIDWYSEYSCIFCGITSASGRRGYILPDDLTISISYVF